MAKNANTMRVVASFTPIISSAARIMTTIAAIRGVLTNIKFWTAGINIEKKYASC